MNKIRGGQGAVFHHRVCFSVPLGSLLPVDLFLATVLVWQASNLRATGPEIHAMSRGGGLGRVNRDVEQSKLLWAPPRPAEFGSEAPESVPALFPAVTRS